jgi:hypothetical protein
MHKDFPKKQYIKTQLITFRGHRFNHLFYAAGATCHLVDIKSFLDIEVDPNELLKCCFISISEIETANKKMNYHFHNLIMKFFLNINMPDFTLL